MAASAESFPRNAQDAGNLSASVNEATWVLTSYLVANAVILPLSGWLANYFGRKRLLMMPRGFRAGDFLFQPPASSLQHVGADLFYRPRAFPAAHVPLRRCLPQLT